jgi:hypothetical protein
MAKVRRLAPHSFTHGFGTLRDLASRKNRSGMKFRDLSRLCLVSRHKGVIGVVLVYIQVWSAEVIGGSHDSDSVTSSVAIYWHFAQGQTLPERHISHREYPISPAARQTRQTLRTLNEEAQREHEQRDLRLGLESSLPAMNRPMQCNQKWQNATGDVPFQRALVQVRKDECQPKASPCPA